MDATKRHSDLLDNLYDIAGARRPRPDADPLPVLYACARCGATLIAPAEVDSKLRSPEMGKAIDFVREIVEREHNKECNK